MLMHDTIIVNGVEIDRVKANRMLQKLIIREKKNVKTKEYRPIDMVNMIIRMIEEEVQCY